VRFCQNVIIMLVKLYIFGNLYVLSHNKNVHDYKTQFTHKEIYDRVNIYIQKTIKTIKYKSTEIFNHHMFRAFFFKFHCCSSSQVSKLF
jgi:hypothetical protein